MESDDVFRMNQYAYRKGLKTLNRNLARIGDWCKRRRMLLNPIKTKSLIILWYKMLAPSFPYLLLDGFVVERVTKLKVRAVIFSGQWLLLHLVSLKL